MKRALLLTLALTGCTTAAAVDITYTDHVHAMPYRSGDSPGGHGPLVEAPSAPAGAHLTYYGGKIIPNVKVAQVLCGSGTYGSQNVYYGVLPDMGPNSGCATGCGNSSTFNNQTSVASHELIEAVTDAEVGLATVLGPPLAWYDNTNGEIGDICNAQQGTFVGNDGVTYTIQQEFSNQQNNCITTRSVSSTPDFGIADSPTSTTIAPGATATINVTTSKINSSAPTITH